MISLDEFINVLIIYQHKLLFKKGNHFPKNEVVNNLNLIIKNKINTLKPQQKDKISY